MTVLTHIHYCLVFRLQTPHVQKYHCYHTISVYMYVLEY